jgi:hypothetical protein
MKECSSVRRSLECAVPVCVCVTGVCVTGVCVLTGYEHEGRERGTRARRASDKGGGTLPFTVRVLRADGTWHADGARVGDAQQTLRIDGTWHADGARVCVSARVPVRSGNPDGLPDSAGRVAGSPRTWKAWKVRP